MGYWTATRALLAIPGGELVNDLGFEFALAISSACPVVYPAYPRLSSIEELAEGLCTILDAEKIEQAAILGASFGGSVAKIFVRKHPDRISALILSNTCLIGIDEGRASCIIGAVRAALEVPIRLCVQKASLRRIPTLFSASCAVNVLFFLR